MSGYSLVALLVSYVALFAVSQGVVVWVLLSEMFPNMVRTRGASLGSFANWAVSASLNFLFPIITGFFGTTQAKQQLGMSCAFFFFSVSTLLGFIYLKKYVIEDKRLKRWNILKKKCFTVINGLMQVYQN
ncbi:MAG: MFS transporter [Mangrovibacterium sp.]